MSSKLTLAIGDLKKKHVQPKTLLWTLMQGYDLMAARLYCMCLVTSLFRTSNDIINYAINL